MNNNILLYFGITFAITYCYYTDFVSELAKLYLRYKYRHFWQYKKKQINRCGIRYIENLPRPFSCHLCICFWCVLILSIYHQNNVLNAIVIASICSAFSMICYKLLGKLERMFST